MSTLPPPATKNFPDDSLERQVYGVVEKFNNFIPLQSDRYRLGYSLFKYMINEGDKPEILVKSTKIELKGISHIELAKKLNEEISKINKK